uniref:Uncharacterized protein n=1 Tax=Hemiselmis andersenii TaxID=464988 RepID=A0A6U5C865_HEMAN|mmetsp:Transcript_25343/g.58723  ORF Transcript_25343/g.58723 Transcript_25343/m.58723 type:complete len:183 (+) Transcript_25343:139-687(+)
MSSPTKFRADSDFLMLGKQLQEHTEELALTAETRAELATDLASSRRALDQAKAQLLYLQQTQQVLTAEADAFEQRAEKVERDVIIKGHEEVNLRREVEEAMQEVYLCKLEQEEVHTELQHEQYAAEHFSSIIAVGQAELQAQIHDRDIYRRRALEMAKTAACQRERVRSFTTANAALLRDVV